MLDVLVYMFDVIYGIMFPLLAGGLGFSRVMPGVEAFGLLSVIMFPIIFGIWGCIGGRLRRSCSISLLKKNRRYSGQSCAEITPLLFFVSTGSDAVILIPVPPPIADYEV